MWRRRNPIGIAPEGAVSTDEDDLEVVLRAIIDRRAFAPLYEKYLTAIHRRCTNRLRNADEAWDATSVTFHKALAALDGFQGGSFEGWLYRICDNACADVHRLRVRHRELPISEEFDWPGDGPDPEDQAIAAMDRDQLDEALRKLPPRREKIVRLHLLGLTGKEIASRLGVSHDVVRQQQRLALQQLADLLGVERDGKENRGG